MFNLTSLGYRTRTPALIGAAIGAQLLLCVPAALAQECGWTELPLPVVHPDARHDHEMVYDASRDVFVLFGGQVENVHSDETWEWDGTTWMDKTSPGPSARVGSGMVFDAVSGTTMLFGGTGPGSPFGDTWEWDGDTWTEIPVSGPSARYEHSMAYDSHRGVSVLFGGATSGTSYSGETWEWDGNTWTQVASDGPSPRYEASMVYDECARQMVLFGGSTGGTPFDDTWVWDGNSWTELHPPVSPSPRQYAPMAFHSVRRVAVLFGGYGFGDGFLNDTWEWNGTSWKQLNISGPSGRYSTVLAYDSLDQSMMLFGGLDGPSIDPLGDMWEFGCHGTPSCNAADIAAPFGTLDLADINEFITWFLAGCP